MTLVLSIIGINIFYVSLNTLRTILVIKGQRLPAALLSVVEVGIYLLGLTMVLQNLTSPLNIMAYCIGFGAGVYIGSCLEQRLALGYVNVQVIVNSTDCCLPSRLREEGYGVTAWHAQGRDGDRLVLQVLAKRSNEKLLLALLKKIAPNAFIVSYEPKNFFGGFWTKHVGTF